MEETARPGRVPEWGEYGAQLRGIQEYFTTRTAGERLFTTDVDGGHLWRLFLEALAPEHRQGWACNACRKFVENYGNLAVIEADGRLRSPLWAAPIAEPLLADSLVALRDAVENARANGVYMSSERVWGKPQTGPWQHLSVVPAPDRVYRLRAQTAWQRRAELREDFRCLQAALSEYDPALLDKARVLLESDTLSRSEKFVGPVIWLRARHEERKTLDSRRRVNLEWRAVAAAPPGFCKPRATMVGSLLDDLRTGAPVEDVKFRFDEKLHPLKYQRPQVAPTAGNIEQAERLFAKLGLAPALERRFATVDDVQEWVWRPAEPAPNPRRGSIFGHLAPKGRDDDQLDLPEKTMTWVKFRDTVLPDAQQLEMYTPATSSRFCAYATATDPAAPPLLRWDREDRRNAVSSYVYVSPTTAARWSLSVGWNPVVGITLLPANWFEVREYQGQSVTFVLEGACDTQNRSLALFPEDLRAELHGVRATVEAHSKSGKLSPADGPLASGMTFTRGGDVAWQDARVRVRRAGSVGVFRLDRWD